MSLSNDELDQDALARDTAIADADAGLKAALAPLKETYVSSAILADGDFQQANANEETEFQNTVGHAYVQTVGAIGTAEKTEVYSEADNRQLLIQNVAALAKSLNLDVDAAQTVAWQQSLSGNTDPWSQRSSSAATSWQAAVDAIWEAYEDWTNSNAAAENQLAKDQIDAETARDLAEAEGDLAKLVDEAIVHGDTVEANNSLQAQQVQLLAAAAQPSPDAEQFNASPASNESSHADSALALPARLIEEAVLPNLVDQGTLKANGIPAPESPAELTIESKPKLSQIQTKEELGEMVYGRSWDQLHYSEQNVIEEKWGDLQAHLADLEEAQWARREGSYVAWNMGWVYNVGQWFYTWGDPNTYRDIAMHEVMAESHYDRESALRRDAMLSR